MKTGCTICIHRGSNQSTLLRAQPFLVPDVEEVVSEPLLEEESVAEVQVGHPVLFTHATTMALVPAGWRRILLMQI